MAAAPDYTGLSGVIVHEGRVYPAAREMTIADSIPLDMYMPSVVPDLPAVIQYGRAETIYGLTQYPKVTSISSNYNIDTDKLCQRAVVDYQVGTGSIIKRAKRIVCSRAIIDNPRQLSDDNPELESLVVLVVEDFAESIFPNLRELVMFAPVVVMPNWVSISASICELTVHVAQNTHYDLTNMISLQKFWVYGMGLSDVVVTLAINDSVQDVRDYGVILLTNGVNRSCRWRNTGTLPISKYTTDIEIDCSDNLDEPAGITGRINRLHVSNGQLTTLGWVTKLTSLNGLFVVGERVSLPDSTMLCLSRLSDIHIDYALTEAHCSLISGTMIKLCASYSHAICQLTNLTALTIKCNGELSPAIYGLSKLKWLTVGQDDCETTGCGCCRVFPPGFSAAFPVLRTMSTQGVIITPDMCMYDRDTLVSWRHYACPNHPPPAELARYADVLEIFACDVKNITCPRALLPTVARDNIPSYDLAPHFADPYDAVRACVLSRTLMSDYLQACYTDGKYSSLLGFLPGDLIREITKYVDDSHVVKIGPSEDAAAA